MTKATQVELLFGRIAVSCGFITPAQLDQAIEEQAQQSETNHLGRLMVELSMLTEEELMTVLAIQRENRSRVETSDPVRTLGANLGTLAVQQNLCTEEEVYACIREQAQMERFNLFFRLGEIMVSKNILSAEKVRSLLEAQNITILGCPSCFSKFNVVHYDSKTKVSCPKCGVDTFLEEPRNLTSIKVDDQFSSTSENSLDNLS